MAAPIIEIDRVSKSFGSHQVLRELSFTVAPGEKLALIGPSGSGKTTILRILMTLETINGGHIRVEGEHLWHMPRDGGLAPADERHLHKMRAKIGMVFQLFNLFPHKTVLENVTLAPMLTKGVPKAEAERRAMELLEMVGMAQKAGAKPAQLSGGQKQRAAIARALALQPRIMLFDEVTSALDPELVGEVLDIIRDLKEGGMTMVIATHEMSFARDVADSVCFLDDGVLLEQGSPADMFTTPRQARTREFLARVLPA
jgi:polar amino acid transport system ATP-binding protein